MLGTGALLSTVRLFVALRPPADAVAALEGLPRPPTPGVRWTTPEQWHITLRFLGESTADEVVGALRAVPWPPPVEVVVRSTARRFGRELLYLPVEGVDAPAAAVRAATRSLGTPPPARPFAGHLTLARARRGGDVRPLVGEVLRRELRWQADEVVLLASDLRATGARYREVERFALRDA